MCQDYKIVKLIKNIKIRKVFKEIDTNRAFINDYKNLISSFSKDNQGFMGLKYGRTKGERSID